MQYHALVLQGACTAHKTYSMVKMSLMRSAAACMKWCCKSTSGSTKTNIAKASACHVQAGWTGCWSSLRQHGSTMCYTRCDMQKTAGTPCKPLPGTMHNYLFPCCEALASIADIAHMSTQCGQCPHQSCTVGLLLCSCNEMHCEVPATDVYRDDAQTRCTHRNM